MTHDDMIKALSVLRPGSAWNLRGDDYKGIEWLDKNKAIPTEAEIKQAISAYVPPPTQEKLIADLQAQVKVLQIAMKILT